MSRIFNIFVPIGHSTTPVDLLDGITSPHQSANPRELTINVFQYRDLLAIKDQTPQGSLIVVNPETFSCGRYYTLELEYNNMVNRVFCGCRAPIICVSGLHSPPSIQHQQLMNACIMRVQPGQECRIINKNISLFYTYGSIYLPNVDLTLATYICGKKVLL